MAVDETKGKHCPVANAYHRSQVTVSDLVYESSYQELPPRFRRSMIDMLYRQVFKKAPDADIHDCQVQVWLEPCITVNPIQRQQSAFGKNTVNYPKHCNMRVEKKKLSWYPKGNK